MSTAILNGLSKQGVVLTFTDLLNGYPDLPVFEDPNVLEAPPAGGYVQPWFEFSGETDIETLGATIRTWQGFFAFTAMIHIPVNYGWFTAWDHARKIEERFMGNVGPGLTIRQRSVEAVRHEAGEPYFQLNLSPLFEMLSDEQTTP